MMHLFMIKVHGTRNFGIIQKSFSLQYLIFMEKFCHNIWIADKKIWTAEKDKNNLIKLTNF